MKAVKKIDRRLSRRLSDYQSTIIGGKYDSKVMQRIETGGYTKPGSRKK